jgi:hemolysin D
MGLIIALFVVALLWACFGKLDIVAVAPGKTVLGGRTKVIQPLEAAVVRSIKVIDGQFVKAGQLLIELDSSGTVADENKASEALSSAQGSEARYRALLKALDTGKEPEPFTFTPAGPEEIQTENRLALSEYRNFVVKRESLDSQLAQRQAELATTREMIVHLRESAELAQSRSHDLEALIEKQFISRHDFLTAKQAQVGAERDLAQQQSRIFELSAAIATQRSERSSLVADFRRQSVDGLRQSAAQGAQYAEDVDKAERRNQLMRLVAPVSGTVQQLAVHTVGGIVTPAQPLLAIVPRDDMLEVEATVLNKDIGFVHAGQDVVVKVESFPYTRYGTLNGKVVTVSHDAAQDEKLGLVYSARVRLDRNTLVIDGTPVRLSAGMNLSVEIKTGKRRVIDYLLSPLKAHSSEALRER